MPNRIAEGLRDQGMAVDVAYDGLEAATKLNLYPYDVVVLDRDLPGIHGDALCQMITDGERPGDDPDADRRRRPRRTRRWARARRRRLPPQAVSLPRARTPDPRARPPQTHRTQPHAARGRNRARPAHRHRHPRRTTDRRSPPKNSPCSKPCSKPAQERSAPSVCSNRHGTRTSTRSPTPCRVTIARLRRKLGQPNIIHPTPGVGYRITEAPRADS